MLFEEAKDSKAANRDPKVAPGIITLLDGYQFQIIWIHDEKKFRETRAEHS